MDKKDSPSGESIPTNEEIVDSLVNELKSSCQVKSDSNENNELESNEELCDPKTSTEDVEDESDFEKKSTKKVDDEDFIDEEFLKEQELSYTEEDKIRLKNEAAELKKVGNEQYKSSQFREAIVTYTLAIRTCPFSCSKERAILYANRGAAKLSMSLTESAIDDCSKAIELDGDYVKALLRRAQLYEKADKLDEALADYKRVLEIDSSNKEAIVANMRLPPIINERNEKLKAEMLGKLKDLGNMVLKPFGLSTNNFQMVPNESGGYSINFKQ
ncbi:hypothetical protein O3M35_012732 [Rhynocoris fuscipes]|uniref:Tetratricopeptide repeat protein 1 n=2 Tax=Reduviidae TaxID=27479 RepID=A0AAW1CU38_9HEMI